MIWGETHEARYERRYRWHQWFAWRPVILQDGRRIWLERVVRVRVDGINGMKWWAYDNLSRRALSSQPNQGGEDG